MRCLIGGVGYHWMRDSSFGLVAADALRASNLPPSVDLGALDYGAILVAQDLLDAKPPYTALVLIAATQRDREPGTLHEYRWSPPNESVDEIQSRIREAGAGVIDLDHLLVIANHFGALPDDVRIIEFEPVDSGGGEALSTQGQRALQQLLTVYGPALAGQSGRPAEAGPYTLDVLTHD